jgi:deoxyhypusine synthase
MKQYYDSYAENSQIQTTADIDHYPKIEGYNFEEEFNLDKFFDAYFHTGIQASNLARAKEVITLMRKKKAKIFLTFTSNMVSSGVREAICFLVKHKLVDALISTAGAIEEDFIKAYKHFVLGTFDVPGKMLFDSGINRTGNIFVPNDRYTIFEQSFKPLLLHLHEQGAPLTTERLTNEMGRYLADGKLQQKLTDKFPTEPEKSILYWAAKNEIPWYCPAVTDGSLGDMIHFVKQANPEFLFDVSADMKSLNDRAINCDNAGCIILGGGVAKHHVLNAMIFREGAEYVVYINTSEGFDASDSGANIQEAVTWGKVKHNSEHVKVHCDAAIAFPLLVAASFGKS